MGKHKELQSLFDGLADAYRELEKEHDAALRTLDAVRGQLDDANKRITRQRRELRRLNGAIKRVHQDNVRHLLLLKESRRNVGVAKAQVRMVTESNDRLRKTINRYESVWYRKMFRW